MRQLWIAALALLSALIFLIVGSPSANAFGSEVLGCDAGTGWTANSCSSYYYLIDGQTVGVAFSPSNMSGSYTTSWTLTTDTGTSITQTCTSTYSNTPCIIANAGCTAGSLACHIMARSGGPDINAALRLTQSGRTRTVTAHATIYDTIDQCHTC